MKLWPARSQHIMPEGPVADLDAIVAEPVPFRFHGKIHYLKPVNLDDFLKFTNYQASLINALKDDAAGLTPLQLATKYHNVISSLCDSITIEDIMSMEQVQIAALYQLIMDMVLGQVDTGDGKKKRQKISLYESVQPSS